MFKPKSVFAVFAFFFVLTLAACQSGMSRFTRGDHSSLSDTPSQQSSLVAVEFTDVEQIVAETTPSTCPSYPAIAGTTDPRGWVPDGPARAYIDPSGATRLIVPHHVTYPFKGTTLDNVKLDCNDVVFWSAYVSDPNDFNDATWLSSPYGLPNGKYIALNHHEYHSKSHGGVDSWWHAITFSTAGDGVHFAVPPEHLVARSPFAFGTGDLADPTQNPGYNQPTNILKHPTDGYYYVIVERPWNIRCLLRTDNPEDPSTWRAWNGNDFTNKPQIGEDCKSVVSGPFSMGIGSLSYSTTLNRFVFLGFGARQSPDDTRGDEMGGLYAFFSHGDSLTEWDAPVHVLDGPTPWVTIHGGNRPGRPSYQYPSFLDAGGGPNFETLTSNNFYLYFIRRFAGNETRQIVRIPVALRPGQPEIANHPQGFYRVGSAGFYNNGYGSNGGARCVISSMRQLKRCGWTNSFDDLPLYTDHGNYHDAGTCTCGN